MKHACLARCPYTARAQTRSIRNSSVQAAPTAAPTASPSALPSAAPTSAPSGPSPAPTARPSAAPTAAPTFATAPGQPPPVDGRLRLRGLALSAFPPGGEERARLEADLRTDVVATLGSERFVLLRLEGACATCYDLSLSLARSGAQSVPVARRT